MNINDLMQALTNGGRVVVVGSAAPKPDMSRLNPAEKMLAENLIAVVDKHGTFDETGCGIWAAYDSGATNEVQNIGVKCANCVMYQGGDQCRIVNLPGRIEPTGKCRFAVIPDGVVKT